MMTVKLKDVPDKDWVKHAESIGHNVHYFDKDHPDWLRDLTKARGYALLREVDGQRIWTVYLMSSVVQDTDRALRYVKAKRRIPIALWFAMNVAPHEHLHTHCTSTFSTLPHELERWTHPHKGWMARVTHAAKVGFAVNAAWGPVRLRQQTPGPEIQEFWTWWEEQRKRPPVSP